MKALLLDIETAPNIVYIWELWSKNMYVPTNQIIDARYVLCWSAKWYGEKEMMFSSVQQDGEKTMLKKIHRLLDEADVVIHYNGKKFDIPALNKEFITHGFTPPSPYKQIDLLTVARSKFKFASNKMDFVAETLGLGTKVRHKGFKLWIECMDGDKESWKVMEAYNKQDVILLEKIYEKMRPWIRRHPNTALYTDGSVPACTTCGSKHFQRRGYSYTAAHKYPRFRCNDCGSWFRGNISSVKRGTEKFLSAA